MPSPPLVVPLQGLRYLGRYTHRVAISNHRLLAFEQERVTFRWKNYAATEFLHRFFLHMLPKGFVRIRHFGFLVNRSRASSVELCRQLLASNPFAPAETGTSQVPSESSALWHRPRCGAAMIVIQRFTAAQLPTCAYFDSSKPFPQSRLADVLSHADLPCVPSQSRRSHATLHPHSCGHFRRCRRSPRSLPSSPMAFQLSTGYQTAIQTP
jgi:hypothetical protein